MHTRHTMTDEQRSAAWDRVAAEMRASETGAADAEKAITAIAVLTFIATIAIIAWAIGVF